MKVKLKQLDKQVRFPGAVLRTLLPHYTKGKFQFANGFLRVFMRGRKPKDLCAKHFTTTRPDGTKLKLLVCSPKNPTNAVGVLWLHGGGFAMGTPEQDFSHYKLFVKKFGCVTVAPYYRLSTKATYPAQTEDCYLALLWLKNHAKELGVNDSQLFVAGNSAGGGLTVATCLMARDKKEVNVAFQLPLYPMLDDRDTQTNVNNDAPNWNTKSNRLAWKMYLGDLYQTENVPVYASPARCQDFSGMPPCCTFIGDVDPFLQETIEYVEKLKKAGVDTTFKVYKGGFHAFELICPQSDIGKDATKFYCDAIENAIATRFAPQPK